MLKKLGDGSAMTKGRRAGKEEEEGEGGEGGGGPLGVADGRGPPSRGTLLLLQGDEPRNNNNKSTPTKLWPYS